MANRKNKKLDWKSISLIVLCTVLALILVLLIAGTAIVHNMLDMVNRFDDDDDYIIPSEDLVEIEDPEETYTGPVVDPGDITVETVPKADLDMLNSDGITNILLVGQDRRENQSRQRSDVMILCTFNTNKNTLTLTSFLRDTYVYIPDYGHAKLNVAYKRGGFNLLNETLAVNFGVQVDANVEVDFTGFVGIVDLMGGIDIELNANEAAYMNKNTGFDYNKGESWNLKAGVNHLTAEQALAYSRIRKTSTLSGANNDWGRTERQRRVLMAMLDKYKSSGITTMLSLMSDVLPLVTTNMTNAEIINYLYAFYPMLSTASLSTQYIPAKGTYTGQTISGAGSCIVPDLAANRAILAEILYND